MVLFLRLIILLLAFISHEREGAIAQYVPPFTSKVAPVTKHTDAATPLYSIEMMTSWVNGYFLHANFLIDIDAPFTWYNCTVDWMSSLYTNYDCPSCTAPVSCQDYICTDVRTSYSYENPTCLPVSNSSTLPGWGDCECPVNVVNPINGTCGQGLLNSDSFVLNASDGRNPFPDFYGGSFNGACAPSSMFESFPKNVSGVMAFSTSFYASPLAFHSPLGNKFALCLPSSLSARGVLFFGIGPYYFLPNVDVDLRSLLSYTPLLKQPDSFGYFIGVKSVDVKGRSIDLSNSTTKLSTIEPYTILRTDVYREVVHKFSIATMGILRARPVAPFGLCLKNRIGRARVKLRVPDIVLRLGDGKNWRISSSNSMKKVRKDVSCLAFVDGGATTEHAIVIGTFQMEDNFLVFDLDNSSLGFSSSLLSNKTSCGNFNFTSH